MVWLAFVVVAFVMGIGTSVQLAMLGQLGDDFGIVEGAWISITLTMGGGAILLAVRAAAPSDSRLKPPQLAAPLQAPWPHLVVAVVALVGYGLSLKGVPAELTLPGLLGLIAMIATSWIIPRTGAAVFLVATSAGLLLGGAALDHLAWFGIDEQRVDVTRAIGVLLLLGGVVLVSRSGGAKAVPAGAPMTAARPAPAEIPVASSMPPSGRTTVGPGTAVMPEAPAPEAGSTGAVAADALAPLDSSSGN